MIFLLLLHDHDGTSCLCIIWRRRPLTWFKGRFHFHKGCIIFYIKQNSTCWVEENELLESEAISNCNCIKDSNQHWRELGLVSNSTNTNLVILFETMTKLLSDGIMINFRSNPTHSQTHTASSLNDKLFKTSSNIHNGILWIFSWNKCFNKLLSIYSWPNSQWCQQKLEPNFFPKQHIILIIVNQLEKLLLVIICKSSSATERNDKNGKTE